MSATTGMPRLSGELGRTPPAAAAQVVDEQHPAAANQVNVDILRGGRDDAGARVKDGASPGAAVDNDDGMERPAVGAADDRAAVHILVSQLPNDEGREIVITQDVTVGRPAAEAPPRGHQRGSRQTAAMALLVGHGQLAVGHRKLIDVKQVVDRCTANAEDVPLRAHGAAGASASGLNPKRSSSLEPARIGRGNHIARTPGRPPRPSPGAVARQHRRVNRVAGGNDPTTARGQRPNASPPFPRQAA